jgi:hypothetical protein
MGEETGNPLQPQRRQVSAQSYYLSTNVINLQDILVEAHTISQTCRMVTSISTTFSFQIELIIRSLFILICKSTSFSVAPPPSLALCRHASSCSCSSCRAPALFFLPPNQSAILMVITTTITARFAKVFTFRCCDLWLPKVALVPHPLCQEWNSQVHGLLAKLLGSLSRVNVPDGAKNV